LRANRGARAGSQRVFARDFMDWQALVGFGADTWSQRLPHQRIL